jgi:hypothetical protein
MERKCQSQHACIRRKGLLFAVTYTSVLPSFTRTGTATFRGEDGGAGGTADANDGPVFAPVTELLLWMEEDAALL